MANKVSLKKKARKKYERLVVGIALVFSLFLVSRLVFKPRVNVETSKIGEQIKLDNRTMQLVYRGYNESENQLTFIFLSPVTSSNALDNLQVIVRQKRADKTNYPTNVEKLSDDLNLVTVKQLSDKWKQLNVLIYPKGKNIASISSEQQFHFVKDDVTTDKSFDKTSAKKDYELQAIEFQLSENELAQEKNRKAQQKLTANIDKLDSINQELEESLSDKTESEKKETESTINQNKSQQTSLNKQLDDLKEEQKELEDKHGKLKNREVELM